MYIVNTGLSSGNAACRSVVTDWRLSHLEADHRPSTERFVVVVDDEDTLAVDLTEFKEFVKLLSVDSLHSSSKRKSQIEAAAKSAPWPDSRHPVDSASEPYTGCQLRTRNASAVQTARQTKKTSFSYRHQNRSTFKIHLVPSPWSERDHGTMTNYPWLKPHEQPRMAEIFREEVAVQPWAANLDFMRLLATETSILERPDGQQPFSNSLWQACFPVQPAGIYYHHTKLQNFRAILESGSIWLRPVTKYVRPFDEMTKFAEAFDLDGYMEPRDDGTRIIDDLAEGLYILCLTSGPARRSHWDDFGHIRLTLEVIPRGAEVELRKVAYALDDLNLPRHPLRVLQRIASERIKRRLIVWKVSRMGAFYLPFAYKSEAETRLLVKQFPGGPPLPTIDISDGKALPIALGRDDQLVQVSLRGVDVKRKSQLQTVRELLDANGHRETEVKVY